MSVWRSAAFGVILDPESMCILCLKRAKTPYRWALPGGKAKLFEGTAKTLRRELREELSVHAAVGSITLTRIEARAVGSYRLHYAPFLAGPRDFEISREHLSAKWLTVDEATTRPFDTSLEKTAFAALLESCIRLALAGLGGKLVDGIPQ